MYEYCTTNSAGNFIFFFLIFSLLLNFPRENGTIFTTWSIHEYSKYNKTTGKEACIMRDYIISCCSTADLAKVSDCDLFIYVGGESDAWVDGALKEALQ